MWPHSGSPTIGEKCAGRKEKARTGSHKHGAWQRKEQKRTTTPENQKGSEKNGSSTISSDLKLNKRIFLIFTIQNILKYLFGNEDFMSTM
jgi:hypothetical protein